MDVLVLYENRKHIIMGSTGYYELLEEFSKLTNCSFAGKGFPLYRRNESIDETIKRIYCNDTPDLVIDSEYNFDVNFPRNYPICRFISDLHALYERNIKTPESFLDLINKSEYDFIFFSCKYIYGTNVEPDFFIKNLKPKMYILPWSTDAKKFNPSPYKDIDITFLGAVNKYYPLREIIKKELPLFAKKNNYKIINPCRILLVPKFLQRNDILEKLPYYQYGKKYVNTLNRSKILIFCSSIYKYPVLKYFEGMASGCLVMADEPGGSKELGFKDGYNFVKINKENWKEKVSYYLENEEERNKIGANARDTILKYHTHNIRAKEMYLHIKSYLNN
jgi:spore maturation protein CgeB